MGLLDDVLGKVKAAGGGEQSSLANEVLGLLSGAGQEGGLEGLIRKFTDKGLGDIVSSWVGTGRNLPIDAEQLKSGLGADIIGQLASKIGISPDSATSKLTALLPTLVDKLTPDGRVPDSATLQRGLDLLRSSLPKS